MLFDVLGHQPHHTSLLLNLWKHVVLFLGMVLIQGFENSVRIRDEVLQIVFGYIRSHLVDGIECSSVITKVSPASVGNYSVRSYEKQLCTSAI